VVGAKQAEQADLSVTLLNGRGFTLLRSEEAQSHIGFETITRASHGIRMTISYPDEFTSRLDVFLVISHDCHVGRSVSVCIEGVRETAGMWESNLCRSAASDD
jgi:hypothetical protein